MVFIGTVRDSFSGKRVERLKYECYKPMAEAVLLQLMERARGMFGLGRLELTHRVGELLPGEVGLVIIASSPHRRESFDACSWLIDELKREVPIWKKEFFADGGRWVSEQHDGKQNE